MQFDIQMCFLNIVKFYFDIFVCDVKTYSLSLFCLSISGVEWLKDKSSMFIDATYDFWREVWKNKH